MQLMYWNQRKADFAVMKGIIVVRSHPGALMPLTKNTSKSMLNFFDKPLISYSLELMQKHNISDICVLCEEDDESLADYLSQWNQTEVRLLPSQGLILDELLEKHTDCVLFEDVLISDFDIQKLSQLHQNNDSSATVVFPEEIKNSRQISEDAASLLSMETKDGIFFLSRDVCHFSIRRQKRIIPSLLEQNCLIKVKYHSGYCSSLPDIEEFRRISARLLEQEDFLKEYRSPGGVILKENTFLEVGAKIKPPVYIGEHVSIYKNAEILPYSVICNHTRICESATISQSVISEHCRISANATVTGAVVAPKVIIGEQALVADGSVYGPDARIEAPGRFSPSAKSFDSSQLQFGPLGILLPEENTHEFLFRLGQACGTVFATGIQGIFKDDSTKAQFLLHSLHAGLQSAGISLYEFPECTLAMCKSACPFYRLKAGFYLFEATEGARLVILNSNGNRIPRETEDAICAAMSNPVAGRISALCKTAYVKPYQLYYIPEITRRLEAKPARCQLCCESNISTVHSYLQKVAAAHQITILSEQKPDVIRLECNSSATEFTLYDEENHPLTKRQIEALIAALLVEERESEFVTTPHTPRAICTYLEQHSVTLQETDAHPYSIDTALNQHPEQAYLCSDPIYLTVRILLFLQQHKLTLSRWLATLPKSFLIEKTVTLEEHLTEAVSRLLHLAQNPETTKPEIQRFSSKKGTTTITRQNSTFTVLSESEREEYAKELTDFYVKELLSGKK